jgi:hypothetical protein
MPLVIISPPYGNSRFTASFPLARCSVRAHSFFIMKKLITCLAVLLLPGCIEFEKQTLVFRHYPETDTLVIWQHYEGIHGEDQEHGLTETEREQLHSVVNGQRTFFFANWALEYSDTIIDGNIKSLQDELNEGIEPKAAADIARQMLAFAKLIKKSVTIKNGPFYLNEQKRLSATQQVTIRNIGKIIRESNALFHVTNLQGDEVFTRFEEGDPNIELLEKSAHAKMKYVILKGQQLQFRWPMTAENFRKGLKDKEVAKAIALARKAGVTIRHKDNLLIITAGKVKATDTFVSIPLPDVAFQPNATDAVSERYGLAIDFDAAKARAKFLKESDARFRKK